MVSNGRGRTVHLKGSKAVTPCGVYDVAISLRRKKCEGHRKSLELALSRQQIASSKGAAREGLRGLKPPL